MTKQEFMAMSQNKGLKVKTINGEILDLVGIINNDVYVEHPEYGTTKYNSFDVIPIFRPLHDLVKDIEHNGEKFVPATRLISMDGFEDVQEMKVLGDYILKDGLSFVPFVIVGRLIEWHFDIAGLIEKNEAIDVNTLNSNPYI